LKISQQKQRLSKMSEFYLNGKAAIKNESEFVQGFIEALFFTETDHSTYASDWLSADIQFQLAEGMLDGSIPCDIGADDLTPESLTSIRNICEAFQSRAEPQLNEAYGLDGYTEEQAGRDFLFTRLGHGVGYWDREILQTYDSAEYDRLTDIMRATHKSDPKEWDKALRERESIAEKSLGKILTSLSGNGEIVLHYDGSALHVEGY
jgi:hypothetical protein